MKFAALFAVAVLFAGMAIAEAPDTSLRPNLRPVIVPAYADVRPVARPAPAVPVVIADVMPQHDTVIAQTGAGVSLQTQAAVDLDAAAAAAPLATLSASNVPEDLVAALRIGDLTAPLAVIAPGGPDDPDQRPLLRPGSAQVPIVQPTAAMRPSQRPYERPDLARGAQTRPLFRAEQNLFAFSPNAVAESLRPTVRPAAFVQRAEEQAATVRRGQICGDPAIQGEVLGRVPGPGACGVEGAVRVRSVAGVTLTSRAVMNCATATALKSWVVNGAKPAVGNEGGGIASLRVVGTYSCRNRNGASTGRLSEHAQGRAIDIAGIGLRNGREVTVLTGWNTQRDGTILRDMWRAACGVFGTVLGPNANRFHRDHFHFDTARYRSGSYCR